MRNALLLIGHLLLCISLFAQNKSALTPEYSFKLKLDSLEKLTDSIKINELCTKMETEIRSLQDEQFHRFIIDIANATNASKNPNKYYRLLATAFSDFHVNNFRLRNFEIISRTVSSISPPASDLLNAILSGWKSVSFEKTNDYSNAIKHARAALEYYIKAKDHGNACNGFTHLAILYDKSKRWKESIYWHRQGLSYAQKFNISIWISLMTGNLGNALLRTKDTVTALKYLNIDLETGKALNMHTSVANTYILLSRIAKKRGQLTNWKTYLDSASVHARLAWPKGIRFERTYYELYYELSEWYKLQGNYELAMKYQSLYFENKRGSDSVEKSKYSAELLLKLEKEYREKELKHLQFDLDQKASLNRLYSFLVITLILFLGTLSYFLYYQRKKTKIEQESNSRLEALNQLKDRMFSVISHDLRSPLASLSGLVELLNQPELTEQEKSYFLEEVKIQLGASMTLLDNLLQWSMLQFKGENLPKASKINLTQEFKHLFTLLHGQAKRKHIQIIDTLPDDLTGSIDSNHFQLIIRNLIGNAIKFSHPNSTIHVNGKQEGEWVKVEIADNGVGMAEEIVATLFKRSTYHTTFGTGGEKGAGLGLNLCYEYALLNGGKLEVNSVEGKGSSFSLYIPAN